MGSGSGSCCIIGMNTALTPEQRERYQNADVIRDILDTSRTIAVVGLSSDSQKASYFTASYMKYEGYTIIPVNPRAEEILGEKCYPNLKSIPQKVDIVDIFRPANEVMPFVEDAIAIGAKAVWMQLRIVNFEAADRALGAGLKVVMDKCVKMEHGRYAGSLHWAGMNTEVISAKRSTK